jgi:hypothetical protein
MSFKSEIDKANRIIENDIIEVVQGAAIQVTARVIKATPVAEEFGGRARNNWISSLNTEPPKITRAANKSGNDAIVESTNKLVAMRIGDLFHFFNYLPYINVLEFGGYPNPPKGGEGKTSGGYSKQAPRGMLRINAAKWKSIVSTIAKRKG